MNWRHPKDLTYSKQWGVMFSRQKPIHVSSLELVRRCYLKCFWGGLHFGFIFSAGKARLSKLMGFQEWSTARKTFARKASQLFKVGFLIDWQWGRLHGKCSSKFMLYLRYSIEMWTEFFQIATECPQLPCCKVCLLLSLPGQTNLVLFLK